MKCLTFEIFTHKTPNPRWGRVGLIFVYYFSRQFMTFPGLLIFWPPKIPTATPFGGGGGFFYRFSRQFMKFTGLLKFWPPTPPPEPPGVGWVKKKIIDFLDSSWHFPEFWFFDPLKFPLRPPPLGWGSIFFRQEPSPDLQGFMQVGKVWGVTLLTRWGQYRVLFGAQRTPLRQSFKMWIFIILSGTFVPRCMVGFNLPTLPHTRVTTFV